MQCKDLLPVEHAILTVKSEVQPPLTDLEPLFTEAFRSTAQWLSHYELDTVFLDRLPAYGQDDTLGPVGCAFIVQL